MQQASYQFLALVLVVLLITGGYIGSQWQQEIQVTEEQTQEITVITEDLNKTQVDLGNAQKQLNDDLLIINGLKEQLDKILKEEALSQEQIVLLTNQLNKAVEEIERLRTQIQNLTAERDELQRKLEKYQNQQPLVVPTAQQPATVTSPMQDEPGEVETFMQTIQGVMAIGLAVILIVMVTAILTLLVSGQVSSKEQRVSVEETVPILVREPNKSNRQWEPKPTAPGRGYQDPEPVKGPLKLRRISDTSKAQEREKWGK